MKQHSPGWVETRAFGFSIICAKALLKPDIYDPTINPVYRDMLAHYRAVALPCRIKDPDRKGKVESNVGHAQGRPLKGLRFETLAEAQVERRASARQPAIDRQ